MTKALVKRKLEIMALKVASHFRCPIDRHLALGYNILRTVVFHKCSTVVPCDVL